MEQTSAKPQAGNDSKDSVKEATGASSSGPAATAGAKPARPSGKAAAKAGGKAGGKKAASAKQGKKPSLQGDAELPKAKKVKVVRDSFTIPELEYEVLARLKKACIKAGFEVKKSELIRIGLFLASQSTIAEIRKCRAALTPLRTGRPKKSG